jgi:MFS family permease
MNDRIRRNAFGFFLAAFLTGDFSFEMQSVAVAWQVFEIRHATIDLGLVGLAAFLPTFVLALFAGYMADRYDRKTIALLAAIGGTLASLAFAALVILQTRTTAPYLAVVLCLGIVRAFGSPAEGTLLVSIVPPERYLAASARYSALRELAVIGGPAAGGALIALGTVAAFAVAAAISAISVIALALLHVERRERKGNAPTLRDALEGVRFILARDIIAGAISLDLVAVLFGGATALLPVYADVILHWGPVGLGVLRSVPRRPGSSLHGIRSGGVSDGRCSSRSRASALRRSSSGCRDRHGFRSSPWRLSVEPTW